STFDTYSLSTSDFLTASSATLLGGASESITVSAVVPADLFGPTDLSGRGGDGLPTSLFELDGNATTSTTHDWDQVYNDLKNGTMTAGARATSFVTDPVNTNKDDIFQGGGSKDTNGIQEGPWLFTSSKPQGKDDIEHAYATLYMDPVTHDQ